MPVNPKEIPTHLLSRITPPHLERVLDRTRLIDFIGKNIDHKIILILGQAAQGKSTLAASYVRKAGCPWAWINMGLHESDPANLFQTLTQAVYYATKTPQLMEILKYPGIAMGIRDERLLYREWLQALTGHISGPLLVVLDGLDRLAPKAPSHGLIEVFMEILPSGTQLILTSRETPPIEIQKLKINQKLSVLENEDLAFTETETGDFFQHIRKTPMEKWETRQAHRVTEGWVGGLVLLHEKLSRLPKDERERFLTGRYLSRFKEEVFQYLDNEIFSSFSSHLQNLLIKASLFDVIEPTFLKRLLNISSPARIFRELTRKNLFVQLAYSNGERQVFRYHQLFRDFLKDKFESRSDIEGKQRLLVRAGDLFVERKNEEEALRCYLEARAYGRALPLFEKKGIAFLKKGRLGDLSRMVSAFPEAMAGKSPWLLFYLAMTRRFSGASENLTTLNQAFSLFQQEQNTRGQLLSLAYLIEACVYAGRDHTPLAVLLKQAETLLNSVHSHRYAYEEATLWFLMGFGSTIRGGNPRKGFSACQNAAVLAGNTGDKILRIQTLIQAMQALSWLGEFSLSDQLCDEIETLVESLGNPALETTYLIARAGSIGGRGQMEAAKEMLRQARKNVVAHGLIYLFPQTLLYELLYKPLEGHHDQAEAIGEQLFQIASSMNIIFMQGVAQFFLGLNAYHEGRFERAMGRVKRASETFSLKQARAEFHVHWTEVVTCLVNYHLAPDETVSFRLKDAVAYYKGTSNHLFLTHTRFVNALLLHKTAQKDEARNQLAQGFRTAGEQGYDHFFFLSWPDITRVCALAVELKVKGAIAHASRLLKTRLGPWAEPELQKLGSHGDPWVRREALEIRRAIHLSRVPVIHVTALGGLRVNRENAPVPEDAWEGHQPKRLLQAILSRGSRNISRDMLMEDLWPEGDPETAAKKFKVTLHRLRKALEPQMDRTFGSSYVHFRDNLVSLDETRINTDVDEFKAAIEEGTEKERLGDLTSAVTCYHRAAQWYGGVFLADELYAPWTQQRRLELQDYCLNMFFRLAKLHETMQAFPKAIWAYERIIGIDPYREEVYRKIMGLHARMGHRRQALRVYDACKKALWEGLEAEPDPLTIAAYDRIIK